MKPTETNPATPEETNRTKLRSALHEFYGKYNTRMVQRVDMVVSDHEGNVSDLNKKLRAKYAADLNDVGVYCSLSGSHNPT
jgi:hypothetical protein